MDDPKLKPWRNKAGDSRVTPKEREPLPYVQAWDRLNHFKPPQYDWNPNRQEKK